MSIDARYFHSDRFVAVDLDLISEVGLADAAVLSLIAFRAAGRRGVIVDQEGLAWWRVTIPELASSLCYSDRGIRNLLDSLCERELLVRVKHQQGGITDQTYSYRVALSAESNRQEVQEEDRQNLPDVPPMNTPLEDTLIEPDQAHDWFSDWWALYPKKVGRSEAEKAFKKAAKSFDSYIPLIALTRAYANAVSDVEKRFIPNPSTWLNQARWQEVETQEQMRREREEARRLAQQNGWTPRPQTFDRPQDDTGVGRPLIEGLDL